MSAQNLRMLSVACDFASRRKEITSEIKSDYIPEIEKALESTAQQLQNVTPSTHLPNLSKIKVTSIKKNGVRDSNYLQAPASISNVAQMTLPIEGANYHSNNDNFYYLPIEPSSLSHMSDDESDAECELSSSSSSKSLKRRKSTPFSDPNTTHFSVKRRRISSCNSPEPFEQTKFTSYNMGLQTIQEPYDFLFITDEEWKSIKNLLPERFVQNKYAKDIINVIIFNLLINCLTFQKRPSDDITKINNHFYSSKRRFENAKFTKEEKLEIKYIILKFLPKYHGYFEIPLFRNNIRYGQHNIIELPSPEFSGLTNEEYNQLLKGENNVSRPLIDHIIKKGLGHPDITKEISYLENYLRRLINNNNFGLIAKIERIILADPNLAPYWTRHLL